MSIMSEWGLQLDAPSSEGTDCTFRPPSWPPPRDWPCITDAKGTVVARWGDSIWPLWPWTGTQASINFGDGPKLNSRSPVIDQRNADILRLIITWRGWGPRGVKSPATLLNIAKQFRKIIAVCSSHKIIASDLSRHPRIIDEVAKAISASQFENILSELERLRGARDTLGFELLDRSSLRRLKAAQPEHNCQQTEYIPPRIWTYLVNRFSSCVADYIKYRHEIESCFKFAVDAYEDNGAWSRNSPNERRLNFRHPFQSALNGKTGRRIGATYYGPFRETAIKFGIADVLERWIGSPSILGIHSFTTYLNTVQYAALGDILSFTLMRCTEGGSLRSDCLIWHEDEIFGRVPLIKGETTKTDPDPNALWITSPSVAPSIDALRSIARLRLNCLSQPKSVDAHYLLNRAFEPWSRPENGNSFIRPRILTLNMVIAANPRLLDLGQITVTDDDLRLARAVTPTLDVSTFQSGKPWRFTWHQLRRTGAVNVLASGDVSDSSLQFELKHLSRMMSLYYGRGNSSLQLSDKARELLVSTQYETMGRALIDVQSNRFISPYGDEQKARLLGATAHDPSEIVLISENDAQHYERAARNRQINFRRTVLGACMKNSPCEGDCISSIGDCAGGNGKSCCINVLFDRNQAEANKLRLEGIVEELAMTAPDTPRYRHLEQERRGLENYFVHINRE